MKQIICPERGRIEMQDVPAPACTEHAILLRTIFSGLSNGTERNQLLGGNYGGRWPVMPGYQVVGEVVECGVCVKTFVPGDVVFCGNTGIGHAEYVLAKDDALLLHLEKGDDPETAALWAISAVAYRNTVRADIKPDEKVLVCGGGVIGQVAAQVAQARDATVCLIAGDPGKLDVAQSLGIQTFDRHDAGLDEQLESAKPFNVCIETSGADVLDQIIGTGWGGALMANEARIALVAGRHGIRYNSNAAQAKALTLYQSAHFSQNHLDEFAGQVRSGKVRLRPLLRDVVPIDEAPEAYGTLCDDPSILFGTVFKW